MLRFLHSQGVNHAPPAGKEANEIFFGWLAGRRACHSLHPARVCELNYAYKKMRIDPKSSVGGYPRCWFASWCAR
jgi:hypothetical protein